ncbi:MAG TPA: hypothetical protein VJY35_05300 [Candidatus Eisenbacteria bacterium]|nr:hypothetical protein [Candidatus Eisenbacteria bacterium]
MIPFPDAHRRWFRLPLGALLAACLLVPTRTIADDEAAPPDLSGTYEFSDSTGVTGTLELKKRLSVRLRKGPKYFSYDVKLHWNVENWDGTGVATFMDNRLYLAWASGIKNLGVSVHHPVVLSNDLLALRNDYLAKKRQAHEANVKSDFKNYQRAEVKGDPWYTDVWSGSYYAVVFKADGYWGVETLSNGDKGETPVLGPGKWSFARTYLTDDGNYYNANGGDLSIEPVEDFLMASRTYPKDKGVPHGEAALMPDANTLVSVFNGDGTESVGYCEIVGKKLEGKFAQTNPRLHYPQTLKVPDKVLDRNPGLFK